jgi:cytochrome P460
MRQNQHQRIDIAIALNEDTLMNKITISTILITVTVVGLLGGRAISAQGKYSLQVPGGLAFSEFRGYESWPVIAVSENGGKIAVIVGNSVMIDALKEGVPGNGKLFPDGARMAKVHWIPKTQETYPGQPMVPGTQHDVDFMAKDSKRFSDSGGWGYAEFEYDAASDTFRPGDLNDSPPQANDAKCGYACHTVAKTRDYVFTEYGPR